MPGGNTASMTTVSASTVHQHADVVTDDADILTVLPEDPGHESPGVPVRQLRYITSAMTLATVSPPGMP